MAFNVIMLAGTFARRSLWRSQFRGIEIRIRICTNFILVCIYAFYCSANAGIQSSQTPSYANAMRVKWIYDTCVKESYSSHYTIKDSPHPH